MLRCVIIETPHPGETSENSETDTAIEYSMACMRDAIRRGDAPLIPHVHYLKSLGSTIEEQEHIELCGMQWAGVAACTVCYVDKGITAKMEDGLKAANKAGRPIEYRHLSRHKPVTLSGFSFNEADVLLAVLFATEHSAAWGRRPGRGWQPHEINTVRFFGRLKAQEGDQVRLPTRARRQALILEKLCQRSLLQSDGCSYRLTAFGRYAAEDLRKAAVTAVGWKNSPIVQHEDPAVYEEPKEG